MELGDIKNFGGTGVLSGPYRPLSGRLSADIGRKPTFEISEIWLFSSFLTILETFFFQNEIFVQNRQKIIKNGSSQLL